MTEKSTRQSNELSALGIKATNAPRFLIIHTFIAWVLLALADLLAKTLTMVVLPFWDWMRTTNSILTGI